MKYREEKLKYLMCRKQNHYILSIILYYLSNSFVNLFSFSIFTFAISSCFRQFHVLLNGGPGPISEVWKKCQIIIKERIGWWWSEAALWCTDLDPILESTDCYCIVLSLANFALLGYNSSGYGSGVELERTFTKILQSWLQMLVENTY